MHYPFIKCPDHWPSHRYHKRSWICVIFDTLKVLRENVQDHPTKRKNVANLGFYVTKCRWKYLCLSGSHFVRGVSGGLHRWVCVPKVSLIVIQVVVMWNHGNKLRCMTFQWLVHKRGSHKNADWHIVYLLWTVKIRCAALTRGFCRHSLSELYIFSVFLSDIRGRN